MLALMSDRVQLFVLVRRMTVMQSSRLKLMFAAWLVLALAACGGGGRNEDVPPSTPEAQATGIDLPTKVTVISATEGRTR
jgi:hypothetical protein